MGCKQSCAVVPIGTETNVVCPSAPTCGTSFTGKLPVASGVGCEQPVCFWSVGAEVDVVCPSAPSLETSTVWANTVIGRVATAIAVHVKASIADLRFTLDLLSVGRDIRPAQARPSGYGWQGPRSVRTPSPPPAHTALAWNRTPVPGVPSGGERHGVFIRFRRFDRRDQHHAPGRRHAGAAWNSSTSGELVAASFARQIGEIAVSQAIGELLKLLAHVPACTVMGVEVPMLARGWRAAYWMPRTIRIWYEWLRTNPASDRSKLSGRSPR